MKPSTVSAVAHLNFRGEAREALHFYQSVFGGEVMAMSYKDFGQVSNEAEADQLIWGQVATTASASWPTTCHRPRLTIQARTPSW